MYSRVVAFTGSNVVPGWTSLAGSLLAAVALVGCTAEGGMGGDGAPPRSAPDALGSTDAGRVSTLDATATDTGQDRAAEVSVASPARGDRGGPCYANHTCNVGLRCAAAGTCVAGTVTPRQEGPSLDAAGTDGTAIPGPGGIDCLDVSPVLDIPWVSQKIPGLSWAKNMCCGPAVATMVKGYVDGATSLGQANLQATVDWMAGHLTGWSPNDYNCSGTPDSKLVATLTGYAEVDAQPMTLDWCTLVSYLDDSHIVIFHASSQGANSGMTFQNTGVSHWLILTAVDGQYAYVNDPGRTAASQGDHRKFTIDSVRASFESFGQLAVIVTLPSPVCPSPPQASVASPAPHAALCPPFHVTGQASAAAGIARITVTVDTDPTCKFSVSPVGAPTTSAFDIVVDALHGCALPAGEHSLAVWVQDTDGCGDKVATVPIVVSADCGCDSAPGSQCVGDQRWAVDACGTKQALLQTCPCGCAAGECEPCAECGDGACTGGETACGCVEDCCAAGATTTPGLGQWTAAGPSDATDCSCTEASPTCWSIYTARATSLKGNQATLEVQKNGGGGPSVSVHYWVVTQSDLHPSCTLNNVYAVRKEGTWPAGTALTVASPVWPDTAAFEAAPCGETKYLHVISGGADDPLAKRWFQYQAIRFTKTCD